MRGLFLLLSLLWVGGYVCEATASLRQPLDRPGEAFTGTLSSVEALFLTVRADSGTLVTFVVDDPAAVPPGLVPGTRVTVRHEPLAGGRRRVIRVGITSHPRDLGATTEPPGDPAPSPRVPRTLRDGPPVATETPPPAPPEAGPRIAVDSPGGLAIDSPPPTVQLPAATPSAVPAAAPSDAPTTGRPAGRVTPGPLQLVVFIALVIAAGALLVFSASRT